MKKVIFVVSSFLLFVGCSSKEAQVEAESTGYIQPQIEIGAPTEVYVDKPSASYPYVGNSYYSDGSYQSIVYEDDGSYEGIVYEDGGSYQSTVYEGSSGTSYDVGFYDEYEKKLKARKKKKVKKAKKNRKRRSSKRAKRKHTTHLTVVKSVEKEESLSIEKKKSRSTILN